MLNNISQSHKLEKQIGIFKIIIWIFFALSVIYNIFNFHNFRLLSPQILGVNTLLKTDLISAINQTRKQQGLPIYIANSNLDQAASLKAQHMLDHNYWNHFAPDGITPWDFIKKADYHYRFAGENLARDYYQADSVVHDWLGSQNHRANLLSENFDEIGLEIIQGELSGQQTILIVTMFGTTKNIQTSSSTRLLSKAQTNKESKILGINHNNLIRQFFDKFNSIFPS